MRSWPRWSLSGGTARRLTSRSAEELSAHYSPDGKWIAFISARDGDSNLYLLPVSGGEARKLTSVSTGVSRVGAKRPSIRGGKRSNGP